MQKIIGINWCKLIPNRWWIESDWSDDDGIFIRKERNPEPEELKNLIKSTSLTKGTLAQMAGVVPSTVSRWISGESPIPPLVLEKLRRIDAVVNEK